MLFSFSFIIYHSHWNMYMLFLSFYYEFFSKRLNNTVLEKNFIIINFVCYFSVIINWEFIFHVEKFLVIIKMFSQLFEFMYKQEKKEEQSKNKHRWKIYLLKQLDVWGFIIYGLFYCNSKNVCLNNGAIRNIFYSLKHCYSDIFVYLFM